jgi:hypothetical protein
MDASTKFKTSVGHRIRKLQRSGFSLVFADYGEREDAPLGSDRAAAAWAVNLADSVEVCDLIFVSDDCENVVLTVSAEAMPSPIIDFAAPSPIFDFVASLIG